MSKCSICAKRKTCLAKCKGVESCVGFVYLKKYAKRGFI